ncbi:NUDIX hydrolase [Sulfoacidibacillus ferrooxidans]|uniref:Methanol dehydrogenase activator n=1 Tax=Sulfoacidibacillus ferrooxidans TaxID=2005001 RepID=A0A9X1V988_9BACL|nr:NUDIX hydrolase [Sulfoacidibacillus ferrooxidans]MCI0184111.1 Methanol dehydrogenase activator [Sulfoacidibacillus ferrooxidans]
MNEQLHETQTATKEIFRGKMISLRVDTVTLPNGKTTTREVVEHPGAVAIVALPTSDEVLLVHQFRYATGQVSIELPAGKLEPNEQPDQAAIRELQEETGYHTSTIAPVMQFFSTPGFSDERMYLYVAKDLTSGEQQLDEDEFVSCTRANKMKVKEMIAQGDITDAKTLVGLLWWLQQS